MRNELHHKTANFLCKNYERILIPEFKTQGMIKNNYGCGKKKVQETYKTEGKEAGKEELIKYEKRKKLNRRTKFVLNMLSHYKFRQYLTYKASEYDCSIDVITEEYTTITCTKCGHISSNSKNRIKTCENCGYKINRDINGSRNILIKYISNYLQKTKATKCIKKGNNNVSKCKKHKIIKSDQ